MEAGPVYADGLVFTLGNVIAIVIATASVVTTILAWVYSARANKSKIKNVASDVSYLKEYFDSKMEVFKEDTEKTLHEFELDIQKREAALNRRIDEMRVEQKEAHAQISQKIDSMYGQLQTINASLSELNGYLRARKEGRS